MSDDRPISKSTYVEFVLVEIDESKEVFKSAIRYKKMVKKRIYIMEN